MIFPRRPAEKIPELLGACDVAFISFQNAQLWAMTIPAKLQSYMACGMPVIASADGETKRIVEEAECGMCCKIGDVEGLAEVIRAMMEADIEAMGCRSRKYFEKHFDKKKLMDEIEKYFNTEGKVSA